MTEPIPFDDRPSTRGDSGLCELRRRRRRLAAWRFLAVCWLVVACTGCIHRRMTITSNPPGAQVLVDGEPIGYTPTSVDFTYYGTREVTLIKDGYKTVTALEKLSTPWYQIPPLEFVTDNLWPMKIRDQRLFHYELDPQTIEPTDTLLERADSLRNRATLP
jgi:hypothetical protein